MKKLLIALGVVVALLAVLGAIGEGPDVCDVAENWRQPGSCGS